MSFLAEVLVEKATDMVLNEALRWDWMSMPVGEEDLRQVDATIVGQANSS